MDEEKAMPDQTNVNVPEEMARVLAEQASAQGNYDLAAIHFSVAAAHVQDLKLKKAYVDSAREAANNPNARVIREVAGIMQQILRMPI